MRAHVERALRGTEATDGKSFLVEGDGATRRRRRARQIEAPRPRHLVRRERDERLAVGIPTRDGDASGRSARAQLEAQCLALDRAKNRRHRARARSRGGGLELGRHARRQRGIVEKERRSERVELLERVPPVGETTAEEIGDRRNLERTRPNPRGRGAEQRADRGERRVVVDGLDRRARTSHASCVCFAAGIAASRRRKRKKRGDHEGDREPACEKPADARP